MLAVRCPSLEVIFLVASLTLFPAKLVNTIMRSMLGTDHSALYRLPGPCLQSLVEGAPFLVLVFSCSTATCLLSNAIIAPLASFSESATGLFV